LSSRTTDDPRDRIGFHTTMKNSLRAKLAEHAARAGHSLNVEITRRLEASLSIDAVASIERSAATLAKTVTFYERHQLTPVGKIFRATK
jgi:hypothetical protein